MDESNPVVVTRTSQTVHRRQSRPPVAKKNAKWPYVLLSLVLGALLWAGIDMKRMQDFELDVELGIQQFIPADWKSTALSTDRIQVSVRGAKQATATIREDSLIVEPKIPDEAFAGDVFEGKLGIAPNQVHGLPPGVQAFAVKPDIISVRLDKVVTRYLTVEPGDITGTPAPGYIVSKVNKPEPPDIAITGPKSLLDTLTPEDLIRTAPISVEGKKGVVKDWVKPLPFVKNGKNIEVEGMVGLTIELTEEPTVRVLDQPVDVKALLDSPFARYGDLTLSPPAVSVTISGPKSIVDNVNPNEIIIYADIRERLPAAPGEYNMKCRSLAPPRIQVVKIEPDTVKWVTREATPAPDKQAGQGTVEPPAS